MNLKQALIDLALPNWNPPRLHKIFAALAYRPPKGKFSHDFAKLFWLACLQLFIVPVDIISPWLAYGFATLSISNIFLLAVFAGLLVETHGSLPAGMLVCTYCSLGSLIILLRKHLSWRNYFPWILSFSIIQLGVLGFEILFYAIKHDAINNFFNFYGHSFLLRYFLTLFLGSYLLHTSKHRQELEAEL